MKRNRFPDKHMSGIFKGHGEGMPVSQRPLGQGLPTALVYSG